MQSLVSFHVMSQMSCLLIAPAAAQ